MIVYTDKKEKIIIEDEPLASGGEGEVRRVTSCPSRFENVCVKLYFKPKQTKEQERKIRFMVDNPPNIIVANGMMIAWPLATVYNQNGGFMGFIMPTAFPDSKKLVILTLPKLKSSHKNEWHKFDKELNIKMALVSRMKLINNIAIPIHLLHSTGKYVLKDFKPDNVLVTPTGKVTIVDMDSIQICDNGKLLFPGTAATADYMPPEFYNKGVGLDEHTPLDKSWDNFAISEVFYQLLFGLKPYAVIPKSDKEDSNTISYCISHNLFPFGKNTSEIAKIPAPHNNFKIVPKPVQKLFIRSFDDNPDDRPQAKEWGQTIKEQLRNIPDPEKEIPPAPKVPDVVPPNNNNEKKTPSHCPNCGAFISTNAKYCKNCGHRFEKSKNPGSKKSGCGSVAAIIVAGIVIFSIVQYFI